MKDKLFIPPSIKIFYYGKSTDVILTSNAGEFADDDFVYGDGWETFN